MAFVIATFYHFFNFPDFAGYRKGLLDELKRLEIKGSLLIAGEGINGTLSGTRQAIDAFLAMLARDIVKHPFSHKESFSDTQPFGRAKVRLKKEIIALGESLPQARKTGEYVDAAAWNGLLADSNVTVIDARNSYEVHLGTFARALNPQTRNFKQLPAFVKKTLDPKEHTKIATFCTGGIRCEKFSSWLLEQGFPEVYQLKGGILQYLEDMPKEKSQWQGECYVFDERVAVGHALEPSKTASMCQACGHALTENDRASDLYIENTSCPWCATKSR
jgi:UPF0176 protein